MPAALIAAAQSGDAQSINRLIAIGVDPDAADADGPACDGQFTATESISMHLSA